MCSLQYRPLRASEPSSVLWPRFTSLTNRWVAQVRSSMHAQLTSRRLREPRSRTV